MSKDENKGKDALPICPDMFGDVDVEEMTETWFQTLLLDLDCCNSANKAWHCLGVKPNCRGCISAFQFYDPVH